MSTCDSDNHFCEIQEVLSILPPIAILVLALITFAHYEEAFKTAARLFKFGKIKIKIAQNNLRQFTSALGGRIRAFFIAAISILTVWIAVFGYFVGAGSNSNICLANMAWYIASLILSSTALVVISLRYRFLQANPARIDQTLRNFRVEHDRQ